MSRIDEALNRRVTSSPFSTAAVVPGTDRAAGRNHDATLEDYPLERAGAAEAVTPISSARPKGDPATDVAAADSRSALRLPESKLVVHHDLPPSSIEQYRRLAATLHELQVGRGLKALVVTSALPRDGKTLTIANLALTLSESYARRVLVIDADLRRPSLHLMFGLSNVGGLSSLLDSRNGDACPVRVSPHLSVLPAGNRQIDPMAALTSDRMRGLLEESTAAYDWVLLDAPPVGVLPDAQVLARLTKAVVLVIGAGSTPLALVERAIAELGRECLVGTVLNRVDEKVIPATSYYRHYYHSTPQEP